MTANLNSKMITTVPTVNASMQKLTSAIQKVATTAVSLYFLPVTEAADESIKEKAQPSENQKMQFAFTMLGSHLLMAFSEKFGEAAARVIPVQYKQYKNLAGYATGAVIGAGCAVVIAYTTIGILEPNAQSDFRLNVMYNDNYHFNVSTIFTCMCAAMGGQGAERVR